VSERKSEKGRLKKEESNRKSEKGRVKKEECDREGCVKGGRLTNKG
jgi:hypothetical protein